MTQAHTSRAHARLAPSAAHRWMHCPGSVKATEHMPDDSGEAAAEGTAAHELCAHCLTTGDDPATFLDMWVDIKAADGQPRFVDLDEEPAEEGRFYRVDEEMVDSVSLYVDFVRSLAPYGPDYVGEDGVTLDVEQRLDMTHLHKEIFGTGDATVLDHANRHLHVVDFKYGRGVVVNVDDNPQLLLYAAGAARRHHNAKIERLTMHIVQPRASHPKGPIRPYEIDLIDLFEFEDTLAKAAAETDKPDAPLVAGPWCHDTFCKLQATCPANRAYRLQQAGAEFGDVDTETSFPKIDDLSPEQEARVLREADGLLAFTKAVQKRAHDNALRGQPPAGFKLVAKRANRKWKDEAEAREHMIHAGIRAEELFTEPKFKSPAQLETFFPGKNKEQRQAAMADLVEKKSSGFNLVAIEDPRPAVNVGASADFDVVE